MKKNSQTMAELFYEYEKSTYARVKREISAEDKAMQIVHDLIARIKRKLSK